MRTAPPVEASAALALTDAASRPIPRYTSYPTAAQFTPRVDAATYGAWLAAVPDDAALSLYLHVPYCVQLCWYCACHTRVANRYEAILRYRDALLAEIAIVRGRIGRRARVAHIHWGGGTPTVLMPEDFVRIDRALREAFVVDADTEIAVEIDPRSLTDAMVTQLAASGVTRVSFGVQDFDDRVQAAINRLQSFAMTRAAVDKLRAAGIASINLDLVYGLPLQTEASLRRTIEQVLELRPDRVALFGYAHVPWMKSNQKLIREADLPGPEARWALSQLAAGMLAISGYALIGIDHFARPQDRLARAAASGRLHRNFQGYTADDAPYLIGFGASAIGALPQGYVQNDADVANWLARIETGQLATARGVALHEDDRLRRDVIERLMCDLAVDLDRIARGFGTTASAFAAEKAALAPFVRDGLVEIDGDRVHLTQRGRPLMRSVAAVFDRHLAASAARHSRAV